MNALTAYWGLNLYLKGTLEVMYNEQQIIFKCAVLTKKYLGDLDLGYLWFSNQALQTTINLSIYRSQKNLNYTAIEENFSYSLQF